MKFAATLAFATAAAALAVPSGKDLVELRLAAPHDYLPGESLYPQREVEGFGAPGPMYTEETFRAEAVKECKAEAACSTVIGYFQEHSGLINGTSHPVWFGWMFGGARATPEDFHHSEGTEHSFVYTINE